MNPFLTNFMRSQAVIQTTVPETGEKPKRDKKGRKKSPYGTADGKHPFGEGDPLEIICTEKPHRKEVTKYFRNRIAELVAADME